ncbi:sensor histidine kinase [Geobacter pickeringii]|uniref:sensor histidine kinase n=1 Tax=Geobacter pickeringii TaxID=345632 RepID=UPI00068F04CF|nr:PAS domain S-box protein [Geobacter pickeringii]
MKTATTREELLKELQHLRKRVSDLEERERAATKAFAMCRSDETANSANSSCEIGDPRGAEARLRDSEERYRSLVESSPDAIVVHSAGRYVYVNGAAVALYGAERADQLIGKPLADFVHLDVRDLVRTRIRQIYEEKLCVPLSRQKLVRLDGEVIDIETIGIPMNYRGEPAAQIIMRDITARVKAEGEIRRLNDELEQRVRERTAQYEMVNRELESFCYSVSHDMRAPLRHIEGYTRIFLEEFAETVPESGKEYLTRICNATRRMETLIDDLLTLSRITTGTLTLGDVDLGAMAREICSELTASSPQRRVRIVIAPEVMVRGDANLLRVALENLLGNAWKYSGKREETEISFGVEEQDGKRVCYVRDNGAGFNMAYSGKLFGAFQRLHHRHEFEGTGVGLATVKRIIQRHGGSVWAEGMVNAGATFYFTLP